MYIYIYIYTHKTSRHQESRGREIVAASLLSWDSTPQTHGQSTN